MPPANSFPSTLSCQVAWCCRAAARFTAVFPAVTLSLGSPAQTGRYSYPRGEREDVIYQSRLQPSHCGGQNLLCVKAALRLASLGLDPQILDRCGY